MLCCIDLVLRHLRSEQDVAHIDLVATLVDELNDVIAEFRLHDLRHLLRICQVESDLSKGRIQHATTHEAQLSSLTGRARILGIETCQSGEACLTIVDALGETTKLVFDTVDLALLDLRRDLYHLYLHLCGHIRQTVLRHFAEIAAHVGRRDLDIFDEFLFHLLDELLVLKLIVHVVADLIDGLLAVLFEFLLAARDLYPAVELLLHTGSDLRLTNFNGVDLGLMEEEFLHGELFGNGTVGIASPRHTFLLPLHTHHLHIGLEDGLITHYPHDFVDDTAFGNRSLFLGRTVM